MNIGMVVSDFNDEVTEKMEKRAKETADNLEVNIVEIFRVPGAYDMPLAVKKACKMEKIDAVVTVGAIIEGDTEHDRVIAHSTAQSFQDLSLKYEKPVALGVSGPGMSREEAKERIDYAERAVKAAVETVRNI